MVAKPRQQNRVREVAMRKPILYNYDAFRQAQIARFDGEKIVSIGQLISVE